MKTYKAWEAIKAIEENEKLEFKNECGLVIKYEDFVIRFFRGDKNVERYGIPDGEWTLIQNPVTFMEAIKAYNEGKTIKCTWLEEGSEQSCFYKPQEIFGNYSFSELIDNDRAIITQTEILKGKWYIEED